MLTRWIDVLERAVAWALGALFAGLIAVVAMQVLARNVLEVPMIWTLDLAQLLFVWCIFLGAALAWRKGGHYEVNLWPAAGPMAQVPRIVAVFATLAVVWVLIVNGAAMTQIATRRTSQTLGISEFWYFFPIPLCGGLIAIFLVEAVARAFHGPRAS